MIAGRRMMRTAKQFFTEWDLFTCKVKITHDTPDGESLHTSFITEIDP